MKGLAPNMKLSNVNDGDARIEHVHIPCYREDVKKLKIGSKITVTIEGTVDSLSASPEDLTGKTEDYSSIMLTVLNHSIRKRGGKQEEGIYLLAEDKDE
jgi:hypothetical protein